MSSVTGPTHYIPSLLNCLIINIGKKKKMLMVDDDGIGGIW